MIIINKGADYSALGLGRLFIPIKEDTENELKGYSAILNEQKEKFQNFKDEIGTEIWNKIKIISIPEFAANSNEVLINAKDGSTFSTMLDKHILLDTSKHVASWIKDGDWRDGVLNHNSDDTFNVINSFVIFSRENMRWYFNGDSASTSNPSSVGRLSPPLGKIALYSCDGTNIIGLTETSVYKTLLSTTGNMTTFATNDTEAVANVGMQLGIYGSQMTEEELIKLRSAILENF